MIDKMVLRVLAIVVTIFFTPVLIRWLRARGIGQQIRDEPALQGANRSRAGIDASSPHPGGSRFTRGAQPWT